MSMTKPDPPIQAVVPLSTVQVLATVPPQGLVIAWMSQKNHTPWLLASPQPRPYPSLEEVAARGSPPLAWRSEVQTPPSLPLLPYP